LDHVIGEQIGGLEVAVQHIMRVAVRQPSHQLSQVALHLQEHPLLVSITSQKLVYL